MWNHGIYPDPDTRPIAPLYWDGEEIPKIDKYVYLGVEFNNKLDFDLMSKFRVEKGKKAVNILTPTLRNNKVPLEYKVRLIKGIIIPTLHYGAEIFGMNEVRVNSLKTVLDNSIKCIVKKSNFCRLRAYTELDIKSIYISSAIARARGFKKWSESTGIISDCISTIRDFKSQSGTWIKNAIRWQKVMKYDITLPISELKSAILADRNRRAHEKDNSKIGEWAERFRIGSGGLNRYSEISVAKPNSGVNSLLRIRTGTFNYTKDLVRLGYIPMGYKDKCISCSQEIQEDAMHLMLYCKKYSDIRNKIFPKLISRIETATEDQKNELFRKLLGEKGPTSGRKTIRWVRKATEYLSIILPLRSASIAEHKGDN